MSDKESCPFCHSEEVSYLKIQGSKSIMRCDECSKSFIAGSETEQAIQGTSVKRIVANQQIQRLIERWKETFVDIDLLEARLRSAHTPEQMEPLNETLIALRRELSTVKILISINSPSLPESNRNIKVPLKDLRKMLLADEPGSGEDNER